MSIVRMGMSERKGYSDGYDAIFSKKKSASTTAVKKPIAKKPAAKKPASKKK